MDRTLTLYHGSSLILKRPQFGKGNPFHDYGLGFYCTEALEVAKEWACSMAQDGFVNRYSFRTDGLSVLNLTDGNYTILNWLSILLMNRKFNLSSDIAAQGKAYLVSTFLPPYEDYDVIIGKQREPWAIGTGKQTSTSHRNDGLWMSFSVFCYSFSRFYVVLCVAAGGEVSERPDGSVVLRIPYGTKVLSKIECIWRWAFCLDQSGQAERPLTILWN